MKITLNPWNDGLDNIRVRIINDVILILNNFLKNDALFLNDLIIQYSGNSNCAFADDRPCTHFDRSIICISSTGSHWCQFVYQLSHELCHCSTSKVTLPKPIKWFDEFICCCASFLTEKYISMIATNQFDYMFGSRTKNVFTNHLASTQEDHIYQVPNVTSFFIEYRSRYENDENLIKKHDVYVHTFFKEINNDWRGLTFIGKMWKIDIGAIRTIEDYLMRLLNICNEIEKETLTIVINMFALKI
ncbi:MAG: hypothetical protein IJY07_03905 [Clostridia bacterium]|nr:hypothetical protein [Clostridia bacterium]